MFLKLFLFYFQKICFFNWGRLKETMSRKEGYEMNFIDSRWMKSILFFLKKVLKPRAMKTHIQILYKEGKSEGDVCKDCKWIQTTCLLMLRDIDFS